MDKKEVLEYLYKDYYLGEFNKNYRIGKVEFDKQGYYISSKINESNKYRNIYDFINEYSEQFFKENLNINLIANNDSLYIDKTLSSIAYPFLLNIDRLKILHETLLDDEANSIFRISIMKIYEITALIILRVLIYNDYLYKNNITSNDRIKIFGTTRPDLWFSPQDINLLNKEIDLDDIKKNFNMFSINIEDISTVEDTKKLIHCVNNYTLLYLREFCTYIFNTCEKLIINYFNKLGKDRVDTYYQKRGKVFERYVKNALGNIFDDVIQNVKYIDKNSKKMELDSLIIEKDICINFECKSAGFSIYDFNDDKETLRNVRSAFGRGYFSIQTFHNTIKENNGIIEIELENKKIRKIDLSNKNIISFNVTLNPIEFLSTSIHFFDEESKKRLSVFPITINIMDLYAIILFSSYINKEIFIKYAKERFYTINNMGKLKIDFDEIDAFGYIIDKNLNNGYDTLKKLTNSNSNIEQQIMINNCAYREDTNKKLASLGVHIFADEFLGTEAKEVFYKLFPN